MYLFLQQQGFSTESFVVAAIMFLIASMLSGYIVLLDILEQKAQQDERLEHLTREILHEINLPIATIDANLSMLTKQIESEKAHKRANRIHAALSRLKRLYTELSYSIKKEILPVEKEPCDLMEIIQERVSTLQELGRNPFHLQLSSCMIKIDRIGLEQTIDNIIANAMKYSEAEAPIVITLKANILSIRDHGSGMDAQQILHIYERYYQGNQHYSGEGIGLTLVKRYCDDQNIEISITSNPNQGTNVQLDFTKVILR